MPTVIGVKHNILIRQYFDMNSTSERSKMVDREGVVFVVNKKGAIVTVSLLVKLVPNLLSGIVFIGFLLVSKTMEGLRAGDENLNPHKVYIYIYIYR